MVKFHYYKKTLFEGTIIIKQSNICKPQKCQKEKKSTTFDEKCS